MINTQLINRMDRSMQCLGLLVFLSKKTLRLAYNFTRLVSIEVKVRMGMNEKQHPNKKTREVEERSCTPLGLVHVNAFCLFVCFNLCTCFLK